MFLTYVTIMFITYLTLSAGIAIIGGYTYREILADPKQLAALVFIYSWVPMFRIEDMLNHNKRVTKSYR